MGNKVAQLSAGKRLDVVQKVFKELPTTLKSRGGYTRIIRLGRRPGDAAPMAYLELAGTGPKPVKQKAKSDKKTDTPDT
jgi:large subunit ribosomal protein L17